MERRKASHPEPPPCSTATARPRKPRVASAASVPRARVSKKKQNGEGPTQDADPTGVAWGLQLPQASLPRGHLLATLGVPGDGASLRPGSFMGTESPGGGSHLQTLPFGALQPPVQRSKISNPFNEASGKIIPLKSFRP